MSQPQNTEITQDTAHQYSSIAHRLINAFVHQYRVDPIENESAFIAWLTQYAERISYPTWRLYRASLVKEMRDNYKQPKLSELIRGFKISKHQPQSMSSSSGKAKRINERSLEMFESFAEEMDNALDEPCLICIKAGMLCGLRPIEWSQSEILERSMDEENNVGEFILKVKNAKATQGRAHGVYRTILFSNITLEDMEIVDYMINLGQRSDYSVLLKRMSSRLSEVNNILFGRMKGKNGLRANGIGLALYSGRHQFAADAKAAKLNPYEIAALMGHGSIDTAFDYYGKKGYGRSSSFRAHPYQKDLDQVERLNLGQARKQNRDIRWSEGLIHEVERAKQAQNMGSPSESHGASSDGIEGGVGGE